MRDYEGRSSLNGEYGNNNHGEGISWYYFKRWTNSLSCARMMFSWNNRLLFNTSQIITRSTCSIQRLDLLKIYFIATVINYMAAFKYFNKYFHLAWYYDLSCYYTAQYYVNQYFTTTNTIKAVKILFNDNIFNFSISVAYFYLYFIDIHERVHLFCSLCKYKESFSNILPEPYLPIIYG